MESSKGKTLPEEASIILKGERSFRIIVEKRKGGAVISKKKGRGRSRELFLYCHEKGLC